MKRAKRHYNIVLHAWVTASAASDEENWVDLSDIEALMHANGVGFVDGPMKDPPQPMTERQQKLCCNGAKRRYEQCLSGDGLDAEQVAAEVARLKLKKTRGRPSMVHGSADFDFDAFRARLRQASGSVG